LHFDLPQFFKAVWEIKNPLPWVPKKHIESGLSVIVYSNGMLLYPGAHRKRTALFKIIKAKAKLAIHHFRCLLSD